jgi:hypothetical protein
LTLSFLTVPYNRRDIDRNLTPLKWCNRNILAHLRSVVYTEAAATREFKAAERFKQRKDRLSNSTAKAMVITLARAKRRRR